MMAVSVLWGWVIRVAVVSFNANERWAVSQLLTSIRTQSEGWYWQYELEPSASARPAVPTNDPLVCPTAHHTLWHVPLMAQGNVASGLALANALTVHRADLVVLYGCAGGVANAPTGGVYVVEEVKYMSLGAVEKIDYLATELVRLKNVFMAHANDDDRRPFAPYSLKNPYLSAVTGGKSPLQPALTISTDKVIKVAPSAVPPIKLTDPYNETPSSYWSYGDSIAYLAQGEERPVLLDMESYGAAAISNGITLDARLLVLRVVTDQLKDHGSSSNDAQQRHLLLLRTVNLAHALFNVLVQGGPSD